MDPSTETRDRFRIDADLLIPGRGMPIKTASCVVSSNHFVYVGPQSEIPESLAGVKAQIKVPTLLPGLWDAHTHYYGAQKLSIDAFYHTPAALAGARAAHDLSITLQAGFTSVRELGGYGYEVSPSINEGTIAGPKVYSAICPISMTGGHGDAHGVPAHALHNAIEFAGLPLSICDGEAECLKAVRTQLRKGAQLIKVCASGGCVSQFDDPEHMQFSERELAVMVEEATRSDRVVAAHCHGKAGIMAALRAGCKTIEHGTYLDEEALELLIAKKATLVMTRNFFEAGLQVPELWSPESWAKLQGAASRHKQAYRMAVKSGAKIALGTDLGLGGIVRNNPAAKAFSHGSNARELRYAVEAGMSPLQAIEAATASASETLGDLAPKTGQLKEGWIADMIGVQGNPLEDISIIEQSGNISYVWKDGELYKGRV